jgi:hypothetical protein
LKVAHLIFQFDKLQEELQTLEDSISD